MNILCRLFEKGICLDYAICHEFTYSSPDDFHSIIISYNENPVKQPLMYGAGVYIRALEKATNASIRTAIKIRNIPEKIL